MMRRPFWPSGKWSQDAAGLHSALNSPRHRLEPVDLMQFVSRPKSVGMQAIIGLLIAAFPTAYSLTETSSFFGPPASNVDGRLASPAPSRTDRPGSAEMKGGRTASKARLGASGGDLPALVAAGGSWLVTASGSVVP